MIVTVVSTIAFLGFQANAPTAPATLTLATAHSESVSNQQQPSATEVAEGTYEVDKDKVRCRYERPVNSRIPQKVCYSIAEWEARQKIQEDELRSGRNRNSGISESGR